MMKKLLLFVALLITANFYAQTPSSTTITFSQPDYETTEDITFTLTFDGGDDGGMPLTEYTFANAKAVLATRNIGGGGFADFQSFNLNSAAINGVHSGMNVAFTRPAVGPGALTSAELAALPTPKEHVMYIEYNTSENAANNFGGSFVYTVVAPATVQDSWVFDGNTYTQAASIDVAVRYSSDMDIAPGGITFQLKSDTTPFSSVAVATYANTVVLPAGTNVNTTIPMGNFPAAYTNGGVLFDNAQLLAANPNGTAGVTNAFFLLRAQASTDPNYTPTTPGDNFLTILNDPNLSVSQFSNKSINGYFYPNPANDVITISDKVETKTYDVVDLYGRTVISTKANGTLNVSNLTKGVYFLVTDSGTAKFMKK